nr:reverse transcriptase domain-containing protein [Tanacetum cinerariifolium]
SSSRLSRDQTSNPTSSTNPTPKGQIRRSSKQKVENSNFEEHLTSVATMTDNRTMVEMLRAPTEGSSKQKVENSNFEEHLTSVATMTDNRTMVEMLRAPTEGCAEAILVPPILAEQFELKHSLINMMTSEQFFGLEKDNPHDHIRAARRWLEKEPPCSITTWDDLVLKFINQFFPPSRTTNLRNEISNFQQKFDESFHEAWERYKDLPRACLHYDFTELHQLDTFYNALNPTDQDSLNAAAGGNLLEKSHQDALTIIENKSKVHNSRSKPIASPVNACDINSSSEIAKLTHAVNQQTSVVTTAMTAMLKQLQANPPPAQVKAVEEICVTCGGAHPYYQCLAAGGNTFPEFKDNIQGFNRGTNFNQEQLYQATTQSNQNSHLNELEKIKQMNDVSLKAMQNQMDMVKNKLRNEMKTSIQTSLSNQTNEIKNMMASLLQMNTASTSGGLFTNGPTVPTPPKSVTPEEDECVEETYTDPDLANELKCKALADLGASINLIPLSVLEKLGLPDLIPTRMTLELANRAICTPDGIARDVFVPVGKFTFPADFVIVDYESDPRVPLILGRPFLRTSRALIDVHGEEMIIHDGDERLTLNMKHDAASYSNHPHRESVNLINIFNIPSEDCLEVLVSNKQSGNPTFSLHKEITLPEVTHEIHASKGCKFLSEELPDINSFNDIHPHFADNPLSGSTTCSYNSLLEEFTDELALITYPPNYDDNLTCDIESDLKEIEFLLYQEIESDADNFYDDLFDSKGEKIKESELLIDQLDLPCDILPHAEYDSFTSQDFSRDDDLPSPNTKDKVFNQGILIHEKSVKIITHVAQEKKLAISYASLVFEDFGPPFYELLVFKDVPNSMRLLLFSSENEEKVFKPGIYTSEKVHSCFLTELSHPCYHVFKVNLVFISLMKIFHVQSGKNTPSLDVLLFHYYPP